MHVGKGPIRQCPSEAVIAIGLPDEIRDPDWLIMFDEPPRGFVTNVPRSRRIAFLSEPPEIKVYRPRFLEQFGVVIAPMPVPGYSGTVIRTHSALPWFYATEDLCGLRAMQPMPKSSDVSVVITRKTKTPQHRARLQFVEQLKHRLGDRLHVFGLGFHPIANKQEAIDPFKYHLALENTTQEHFWTEKVADPYLGWSLPLYSGCPNLGDYFPDDAFVRLDLSKIDASIATVVRCLDDDIYDSRLPAITIARQRLLDEHNIFAMLQRIVMALAPSTQGRRLTTPIELWSNGSFDLAGQLARRVKAAVSMKPAK